MIQLEQLRSLLSETKLLARLGNELLVSGKNPHGTLCALKAHAEEVLAVVNPLVVPEPIDSWTIRAEDGLVPSIAVEKQEPTAQISASNEEPKSAAAEWNGWKNEKEAKFGTDLRSRILAVMDREGSIDAFTLTGHLFDIDDAPDGEPGKTLRQLVKDGEITKSKNSGRYELVRALTA